MSGDEAGTQVTLDGEALGLERVGQPLEVDPGTHRAALLRDGAEVGSREVTLAEGESQEITLVATAVQAPVDDELLTQAPPPPPPGGSVLEEWWFWTILAAVVVVGAGVATGVVLGTQSPSPVQGNLSPGSLQVTLP